jgi:hypothetical protein
MVQALSLPAQTGNPVRPAIEIFGRAPISISAFTGRSALAEHDSIELAGSPQC